MRRKLMSSLASDSGITAEAILARSNTGEPSLLSAEQLLHELQVHQIELQMQNEELRLAQCTLEEERDRYLELYDFAPCGYITLSDAGIISEINLTGAELLGEERRRLNNARFARFIVAEDKDRWYRFLITAMKQDLKKSCELSLQRKDGTYFYARLECIRIINLGTAKKLRISFIDQTEFKRLQLAMGQNISELKNAHHTIEESRAEIRGLASRTESVREEERKHIAREVHDELGQILTGLQMKVSMLSSMFGQHDPALHDQLNATLNLVNQSLEVARNVASSLRPSSLDMGIISAIEWLTDRFEKSTSIKCELRVHEKVRELALDENTSNALFRISQESLTNIVRHSQASQVEINIGQADTDYVLEIKDNGCGFDSAKVKAGSFGLVGIRERVLSLGGELRIESFVGKGTTIKVRLNRHNISDKLCSTY